MGGPGAGKGTLSSSLEKEYNLYPLSSGSLFRENVEKGTALGKKVKEILAKGDLVSDDITINMVREKLNEDCCKNGIILDGFPRSIAQAIALEEMIKINFVINLSVDEDVIIRRISGRRMCPSTNKIYHLEFNPPKVAGIDDETGEPLIQRDDDKPDSIRNRLAIYNKITHPLIDYYKNRDYYFNIKANGKPEPIFLEVKNLIDNFK